MVDAKGSEVCGRVKFRVQTDDESNIALGEMRKNVLEWPWKIALLDGGGVGGNVGIQGRLG